MKIGGVLSRYVRFDRRKNIRRIKYHVFWGQTQERLKDTKMREKKTVPSGFTGKTALPYNRPAHVQVHTYTHADTIQTIRVSLLIVF